MKKKIYSAELRINLKSGKESEFFKWFLACLLFGKPIQRKVAENTYLEFEKAGLSSPDKILKAGWKRLVKILDRGRYVRYDFSTATKLMEIFRELKSRYGTVTGLLKRSGNKRNLERRLLEFKGIGPVTAKIFIRDINLHP